jgi:hypothetical protein
MSESASEAETSRMNRRNHTPQIIALVLLNQRPGIWPEDGRISLAVFCSNQQWQLSSRFQRVLLPERKGSVTFAVVAGQVLDLGRA